jgi:calcineurin-like phosphoesterase family protein
VHDSAGSRRAGQNVLLSHFPHAGSPDPHHANGRYDQWRLAKLGAWFLHGYTHCMTQCGDHGIHVASSPKYSTNHTNSALWKVSARCS